MPFDKQLLYVRHLCYSLSLCLPVVAVHRYVHLHVHVQFSSTDKTCMWMVSSSVEDRQFRNPTPLLHFLHNASILHPEHNSAP